MTRIEHYDWENNLRLNISILHRMGLWPKGDEIYKPGFYRMYCRVMVTICIIGHVSAQAINVYFVRDSFESVVGIIYVLLIEFMGAIKALFLITKMKFVKENMIILRSDWFQPKDENQKMLIEPSIGFWRTVYKMLLSMCLSCNAFYMVFPFLDKSTGEKRFPFLAWYPYDYKSSPYYEMTYVFQVVSTGYLTLIHLNVDTLISGFNVYIACQFDLLIDDIKKFSLEGSDAEQNLIQCVIHHKRILSFIDSCCNFFKWIILWHLIMSGVSIGITMFQLILLVPFSNEFNSILSYGFAITIQIFMYCWFGNEVAVKSNLISYSIFESNWTHLPEDVKKQLLIFSMNVADPVKISAFNIFRLSLDTFMSILKTAWSYFALLHQLGSRK